VGIHNLERETLKECLVESSVGDTSELRRSLFEKCFESATINDTESNEVVAEAAACLALTSESACDLFP
jgi:predicted nuclease of restriction endonuclease-like RecB superfamily